LSVN